MPQTISREQGAISGAASANTPTLAPIETEWFCPYCGETEGTAVDFDFGRSSETGYHDAGECCTLCITLARSR